MGDFRKRGTRSNLRKSFVSSLISNLLSIWKNAFVAFAGISHYLEVLHFCAVKNKLLWYQSEQGFWFLVSILFADCSWLGVKTIMKYKHIQIVI